jgi:hypothetical protein
VFNKWIEAGMPTDAVYNECRPLLAFERTARLARTGDTGTITTGKKQILKPVPGKEAQPAEAGVEIGRSSFVISYTELILFSG